jgi:hypothetical protein
MSDDATKNPDAGTVGAIATIANSRAVGKLANAVEGLVQLPHNALDYLVGPDRIRAVRTARAEGALIEARAQAEIERLRAETGAFVLDREMHKTLNRRAILAEAQKALPPPGATVSDEPVSKDFVHAFFDEFDGISDPEVHKIVGRLLAGEVVRPGSFPRRTMRVLRDLESRDFAMFATLCRFSWNIGGLTPLVHEIEDPIYQQNGLSFDAMHALENLGLLTFESFVGYLRADLPAKFRVTYGIQHVQIELKAGETQLDIGKMLLSEAGSRLAVLTRAKVVPEFVEYVLSKWRAQGHKADVINPAAPATSSPAEPSEAA